MVCQRLAVYPSAAFLERPYPDIASQVFATAKNGGGEILLEVLHHLILVILHVEAVAVGARPAPPL